MDGSPLLNTRERRDIDKDAVFYRVAAYYLDPGVYPAPVQLHPGGALDLCLGCRGEGQHRHFDRHAAAAGGTFPDYFAHDQGP